MLTSMSIGGIAVVLVNTTRDVLGPFKSAPNATGLLIRGVCAACPGHDNQPHLSYRRAKRCLCQSWKCHLGKQKVSASRMAADLKSAPDECQKLQIGFHRARNVIVTTPVAHFGTSGPCAIELRGHDND